ncbi:MAG: IclR family transcriptional regulator [Rhodoferax sp.]|nr:IclR family transcriptional regulator [Rhodoferax sp.]
MDPTEDTQALDSAEEGKDRQFVTALARGLDLLRCFRPNDVYLSHAELARRTNLPKPTVSRLIYTLKKLGYLAYSDSQGKYQLASGVLALGYSLLGQLDLRKIARPAMQELAEYSQASVAIGIRDRLRMVYVQTCQSSARVTLRLDIGSRIPIATTAMGKALLCGLPQDERDLVMDQIRLADQPVWPRVKAGVEQALRDYQERGFCLSEGDWQTDVHAVGVPLIDPIGQKQLAFNCGGPAYLLPRDLLLNDLGPKLVLLVRKVQADLGTA